MDKHPDFSLTDVEDYMGRSGDTERGGDLSPHHPEFIGRMALQYGPNWLPAMRAKVEIVSAARARRMAYDALRTVEVEPVTELAA